MNTQSSDSEDDSENVLCMDVPDNVRASPFKENIF